MFDTFFQSKKHPLNSEAKLLTHSKPKVKPSRVIGAAARPSRNKGSRLRDNNSLGREAAGEQ